MRPFLFVKVCSMEYYAGVGCNTQGFIDRPCNGGSYYDDNDEGMEVYNFKPVETYNGEEVLFGRYYSANKNQLEGKLHLEKVYGANASSVDESIDDVTVIFCATPTKGSCCVVGWYDHATIYRERQWNDDYPREHDYYSFEAKRKDCVLLPVEERAKWHVPHSKTNSKRFGFGQANIWYGDSQANPQEALKYVERILQRIDSYKGKNIIGGWDTAVSGVRAAMPWLL